MATRKKCSWWRRWWHGRLRMIDVQTMLPALQRAALKHDPRASWELRQRHVNVAWFQFINEPGQEHWHCECALAEQARADRADR